MASVGNDTVKRTVQYVSYTTRVPHVFFFFLSLQLAVELDHLCGVENLYTAQGEWSDPVVFMARHP